jgi:hypothetical protein
MTPDTSPRTPSRDSLTSVNEDGSRYFIHPADVRGTFSKWRRIVGWFIIVAFVFLPWIPIGGHPAVHLNIGRGQFHLFGLTLVAQDLYLLFFLITGPGIYPLLYHRPAGTDLVRLGLSPDRLPRCRLPAYRAPHRRGRPGP